MANPSFRDLMARADEETLQHLLGKPTVRLLLLLNPDLARPSQVRGLVSQLRAPWELLREPDARRRILELLTPEDAVALLECLGLDSVPAPYEALSSLKLRKGSTNEAKLCGFLGVELPPEPHRDTVLSAQPISGSYGLFPHQRKAALGTTEALHTEPRRVLLHMPTGSGKTRTAMHVIAEHLRDREPTVVMWLAYSEELCQQAAAEFELAWTALGNREVSLMRYWGMHSVELDEINDGFLVAGLGKMYAVAKRSIEFIASVADRTSLVVIDEAHQAVAETYGLLLEVIFQKQPQTGLLGMTATPGRTWSDIAADEALSDFFSRRKVGLEIEGYDNPVDYLIDEGYLARPTFVPLTHAGGIRLSARDETELAQSLDIPERILRKLAEDEKRNLAVVHRTEELMRRHSRVLVFAATVDHARLLATVLTARGHNADYVTAQTESAERRRIIAQFRSGGEEPRVLCNYGVLTTGFDAPRTSAAVIARPTASLVLYFQMVGRAIRGPKAGGNSSAEIVTVVDAGLPGFWDVGEAFTNWEDVWK